MIQDVQDKLIDKRDEIIGRLRTLPYNETMVIYREGKVAGLNLALFIIRQYEEEGQTTPEPDDRTAEGWLP
jgi:hypothetical protein